MSSARASTASWASSPSAWMVMLSPLLAPSVMILSELFAFASRSPFTTTMSDENCFAALTNCAAGRAWSPSCGPTVVSLSATNRSSPTVRPGSEPPLIPVYQSALAWSPSRGERREKMVRRSGLRRHFDRLDLRSGASGEERFWVDGERNLALRGGIVTACDLQRPLDTLGLDHHPEARGAAAHPNRDPYHLRTSMRAAFALTAPQSKPSLLHLHNRCINNRRQFFERPRSPGGRTYRLRACVAPRRKKMLKC